MRLTFEILNMKDRLQDFYVLWEKSADDKLTHKLHCWPCKRASLHTNTEIFFEKTCDLQTALRQVRNIVLELEKKQNVFLTSAIVNNKLIYERDALIDCVKENMMKIHKEIKMLKDASSEDSKYSNSTFAESKMKRGQLNGLLLFFQETMSIFNNVQFKHREQCRNRIQRQLEISGNLKSLEDVESMLDEGNMSVGLQATQLQVDTQLALLALQEVEQRHLEIIHLDKSLTDLFELFKEVSQFVECQGDLFDNIEAHVNTAEENISAAKQHLYCKRKALCYCLPCSVL